MNDWIYVLFLMSMLFSCSEDIDDDVYVTNADKNWYVVENKPGELNQLLYKVYTEIGMPIFYNDTLGVWEDGVDAYGKPVIRHELLMIGYTVSDYYDDVCKYVLSDDEEGMIAAVEVLQKEVFPKLSQIQLPNCILLVDTLYTLQDTNWVVSNVLKEVRGTVVGINVTNMEGSGVETLTNEEEGVKVINVKNMTPEAQQEWGLSILNEELAANLAANYSEELNAFYEISRLAGDSYGWDYSLSMKWYDGIMATIYNKPAEYYGLLEYVREYQAEDEYGDLATYKVWPSETEDVKAFLMLIETNSEENIRTTYETEYPNVWDKYLILKGLLVKIGLEL